MNGAVQKGLLRNTFVRKHRMAVKMIRLGIDLGKARTGLAICDRQEMLAVPLCVVAERNPEKLLNVICAKITETGAEMAVVGLPKNMDGSEGESAVSARAFAKTLSEAARISVDMQDERGTTVTAHNYLNDTNTRGKKRKQAVDTVAATVILQSYLDMRRMRGMSPDRI